MIKLGFDVPTLKNEFQKKMETLKAQLKERAKIDFTEKESLKQSVKQLKKDL